GEMSFDPALYREVVERIRESDTDVIINLTAGGGGDWTPSEENPANGGPGTFIQTPEERHQSVGELLPEICTLDACSLNFGDMVYINPENWIRKHAELIKESGVKPEIECFDTGVFTHDGSINCRRTFRRRPTLPTLSGNSMGCSS